ncbi:hypothetical protein [Amorphus orientalis]|uniref:Transmembrane protein n=1 Tax=Amorphus orientalis TaxID=649198 RepID=A0AAE4ATN6_9HYPH|nr:hypothetical protein [Amorphus orientalis]MDQ0315149.1 hypothetical protein [Amorphus orientalis]
MISAVPLTIVPLILYNVIAFVFAGGSATSPIWGSELFSLTLVSGHPWTPDLADLIEVVAVCLLGAEIIKATRVHKRSVLDHLVSTVVMVVYVVEFLAVGAAATSTFFLLTVLAIVDVMAGFTISLGAARRDVSVESSDG